MAVVSKVQSYHGLLIASTVFECNIKAHIEESTTNLKSSRLSYFKKVKSGFIDVNCIKKCTKKLLIVTSFLFLQFKNQVNPCDMTILGNKCPKLSIACVY